MDENESKSPWDELAGELGAEPTAESFERKQIPATEIPPIKSEVKTDSCIPQQASPSDWGALAGSLGLEVDDEPAVIDEPAPEAAIIETPHETTDDAPVAEVVAEQTDSFATDIADDEDKDDEDKDDEDEDDEDEDDDSLPPLPSEIDQVMGEPEWSESEPAGDGADFDESDLENSELDDSELDDSKLAEAEVDPGISGDDARNAFDALFTASGSAWAVQEPDATRDSQAEDRSEPLELDAVVSDEDGEKSTSEDDDEERRPRRRRPRRRRRGRGGSKSSEENTTHDEAESATDEAESATDETEDSLTEEVSVPQDEEEKPRRRRPRRRSRRSSSSGDPTTDEKNRTDQPVDDLEDDLSDTLGDSDDEANTNRGGSSASRAAHRNLPTWSEAIGCIVDANLEQRSKSPSKPNSSRGGRGRGGRRRSGDKKN